MTQLVGLVAALVVILVVVRLVLRGSLTVRYGALWLLVSLALLVVGGVPGLLTGTARLLGFEVAANLLFSVGLVFLLLVGIHLSIAVTRLEQKTQRLAEEVAILVERTREGG